MVVHHCVHEYCVAPGVLGHTLSFDLTALKRKSNAEALSVEMSTAKGSTLSLTFTQHVHTSQQHESCVAKPSKTANVSRNAMSARLFHLDKRTAGASSSLHQAESCTMTPTPENECRMKFSKICTAVPLLHEDGILSYTIRYALWVSRKARVILASTERTVSTF